MPSLKGKLKQANLKPTEGNAFFFLLTQEALDNDPAGDRSSLKTFADEGEV